MHLLALRGLLWVGKMEPLSVGAVEARCGEIYLNKSVGEGFLEEA